MLNSDRSPRALFIFLLLLLWIVASLCAAQDLADEKTQDTIDAKSGLPIPISLTTSGGVSLGGYQAGYLYYFTELVKRNRHLFDPKLVTGSSAGTLNSIIALMALGSDLEDDPRQSQFFKMWTSFRHDELIDTENAPNLALSSRRVLEKLADRMEDVWEKGLDEKLDIVVGVTATRVKGRPISVSDGFSIPRQEEKFVFRVRGRGLGNAPLVSNYVDKTYGIEHPLLPFTNPDEQIPDRSKRDFAVIRQVMFASSAFPLAFPPQEIDFCMTSPSLMLDADINVSTFRDCPSPTHRAEFVDGSLFDRNPLRLAHRIAASGLQKDSALGLNWKDIPNIREGQLPDNLRFVYLDVGHASYPPLDEEKETNRLEALFPTFGAYSQGFVRAAQAKELYTLIDDNPQFRDRITITARELPPAGELLANFFGFFDRKFRVFDFYLGMHDARRNFFKSLKSVEKVALQKVNYSLPEEVDNEAVTEAWAPYFCLRSVLDGEKKYSSACETESLEDFRILLKVSLDRLYDHCSRLPEDETVEHVLCKKAMDGELPPRVKGMVIDDDLGATEWRREDDEGQLKHTLRLLKDYHFLFEDLGLDRDEAWLAMSEIREFLAGHLDMFSKKLPFGERVALRTLGKPALNFFTYQPPQAILYFAAGKSAEVGFSVAGGWVPSRWLRFNFALQFQGLIQLLSLATNVFAMTPLFGLEVEIPQLSSPMFQARVGARIGYQFSTADGYLRRSCNMTSFSEDSASCSAPVGQAMIIFTFYERIRIQGGIEWFPYFLPPMDKKSENEWNGFIEIGWQWISPF